MNREDIEKLALEKYPKVEGFDHTGLGCIRYMKREIFIDIYTELYDEIKKWRDIVYVTGTHNDLQAEKIIFLRGELKKMMDDIKPNLTDKKHIDEFNERVKKYGYLG